MHREFYTRLISREHPLPEAFVPEHLIDIGLPFEAAPGDPKRLLEYQAAKAASQLFHACHRCGLNLWAVSGYRSYQRQKELFTGSPFVAEPGTSEHQSGLLLLRKTFRRAPYGWTGRIHPEQVRFGAHLFLALQRKDIL